MAITLEEYQNRLQGLAAAARQRAGQAVIVPAANRLLASIKNRIQVEGENSTGAKIGAYSTKPIYANVEQFVKRSSFKPQGKNGRANTGGGRPRKSMYLQGGYKQLRQVQGRPVDKKNYTYRGDLLRSFVMQQAAESVVLGFNSQLESKKRQGLERKDGKVFYATQREIDIYTTEVSTAAADYTRRLLTS